MKNKKLLKQIAILLIVVILFVLINIYFYIIFTRRLANNFSGTNQIKMVDVELYLPHELSSHLPRIETDFKMDGDLPILDGAAALVPVYSAFIDNVYPKGSVTYIGGKFSDDNYYGENFADDSVMQYHNTIRGFEAVTDGKTDIFFCASPSDEQLKYAENKGVELVYTPVGLEAFVFFVNAKNPVDILSIEQIRGIYSGKYTNWSEVGGVNRTINPVTRIKNSGSQTTMERFMGDIPFGSKSPFIIFGGSIGYSFRYYMNGIVSNPNVKIISLNGVYPSPENIQNREYPIISEFYAVYRKDNSNENIPKLVNWILSDEGQQIIEDTGYIRIN